MDSNRRLLRNEFHNNPSGKKFRSKPQLSRYLGNTVDLGCFDFRTGKMMPSKIQKNKQRLRSEHLSLSKVTGRTAASQLQSSRAQGIVCAQVHVFSTCRFSSRLLKLYCN
ncbi:methyl-CpG-binding domain protein 2 [Tachysurus ichikawai]